jgi:hypothetical protein
MKATCATTGRHSSSTAAPCSYITGLGEQDERGLIDVHRSFEDDGTKVIAVSFLFGFVSPKDTL